MYTPDSMSNYSKAARGLFVLLRTDGIFTVNALSPSSSSRQCPYHYAIHAGLNLPGKEFRYFKTVIVTAAVHRGFSSKREPFPLTFRHRAGVSPYTSTFVLAETCVFGKQLHGLFSCGLSTISTNQQMHRPLLQPWQSQALAYATFGAELPFLSLILPSPYKKYGSVKFLNKNLNLHPNAIVVIYVI
jgi:hypothetical protein